MTTDDIRENISLFLSRERDKLGISKDDFANVIGARPYLYYKYEAKTMTPTVEFLANLADMFETTVDEIIGHDISLIESDPARLYREYLESLEQKRSEWRQSNETEWKN